jgi:hypothetical protein
VGEHQIDKQREHLFARAEAATDRFERVQVRLERRISRRDEKARHRSELAVAADQLAVAWGLPAEASDRQLATK